ncbi:MAG: hypothetical protein QOG08_1469 [Chloroflexota bacterium]|jgi:hypothetical protein|nr:hypothetical protein [Chloroflexota bacterium]
MRDLVRKVRSAAPGEASAALRHDRRSLTIWLALLAQAQMADVITTQADTFRGGVEANQTAAFIMQVGGAGLFCVLKIMLVLGMAAAVSLAFRYRERHPGRHAELCVGLVARTIQVCVLLLTLTVLGNASVAAQLNL